MPLLVCPNDSASMQSVQRNGVEFDFCPTCRGVWLDRGELNKLLDAERQQLEQSSQAREKFQNEVQSFSRDPDGWRNSHKYDSEKKRYRYDGDDDDDHGGGHGGRGRGHGGRGRRGRFSLLDLFD